MTTLQFANLKMALIEIVDLPLKDGGSFHSIPVRKLLVYQGRVNFISLV